MDHCSPNPAKNLCNSQDDGGCGDNSDGSKGLVELHHDDSHHQSCQLIPVSTGKFTKDPFDDDVEIREFKMLGMPESIQQVFDLVKSKERFVAVVAVVIWIGDDDAFFHTGDIRVNRPKDYLFETRWNVSWRFVEKLQGLSLCSKTPEGINGCLGALVRLPSNDFDSMCLAFSGQRHPRLCPFPSEILDLFILQNEKGKCGFVNMTFTPSQGQCLATRGKKTHLFFSKCSFQDGGMAFMDAYLSPDHQESGPAKLEFLSSIPLDDSILIACLSKLQELRVAVLDIGSALSQVVVSTELECLTLSFVKLGNEAEQMLIHNIRTGCGPKGICLDSNCFSSREKFLNFCEALSYQNEHHHLKTLELSFVERWQIFPDLEVENALLTAWRGNSGLTSFSLKSSLITGGFWNSLLNRISLEPSLRKLEFDRLRLDGSMIVTKRDLAEHLANLILANERIEVMKFGKFKSGGCGNEFGVNFLMKPELWKQIVVPALEHNVHRERFAAIEKISIRGTRKAILVKALTQVSGRPSLLYALLHQHLDVLVEGFGVAT